MPKHSELVAELEAAVEASEFRKAMSELPQEVSARIAKLATVLGLDALEAMRGNTTLQELEGLRRASTQGDEEIEQRRRGLDPTGDEFDSDRSMPTEG